MDRRYRHRKLLAHVIDAAPHLPHLRRQPPAPCSSANSASVFSARVCWLSKLAARLKLTHRLQERGNILQHGFVQREISNDLLQLAVLFLQLSFGALFRQQSCYIRVKKDSRLTRSQRGPHQARQKGGLASTCR
jgi:hypothetical protein